MYAYILATIGQCIPSRQGSEGALDVGVPVNHGVSAWYGRTTLHLVSNRTGSCELE